MESLVLKTNGRKFHLSIVELLFERLDVRGLAGETIDPVPPLLSFNLMIMMRVKVTKTIKKQGKPGCNTTPTLEEQELPLEQGDRSASLQKLLAP